MDLASHLQPKSRTGAKQWTLLHTSIPGLEQENSNGPCFIPLEQEYAAPCFNSSYPSLEQENSNKPCFIPLEQECSGPCFTLPTQV